MYKIAKFNFVDRCVDNYWTSFMLFGDLESHAIYTLADGDAIPIQLDKEATYQIGIDQSTSNTGIVIKDYKNTEFYMIEKLRASGTTSADYMFELEMFLHKLLNGCTVSHVIYEQPIETQNYRSARVLFQLEGVLIQLGRRYKEFNSALIEPIPNASWRSVIVSGDNLSQDRKQASRLAIQSAYKWSYLYGESLYKDQDVYEAFGILMGWFIKSFDPLGRPYVRGIVPQKTVGGYVIPNVASQDVVESLTSYGIKSILRVANPELSVAKNLSALVDNYTAVCVEFTDSYSMLSICIEANIKFDYYDVVTVVVTEANKPCKALVDLLGESYHYII